MNKDLRLDKFYTRGILDLVKNPGVLFLVAAVTFCAVGAYIHPAYLKKVVWSKQVTQCGKLENNTAQIECAFKPITEAIKSEGLEVGMEVFAEAYTTLRSFVVTGCHKHAHRVGDIAYYQVYFGQKDLSTINFPQSTTACGYGFYHGFLEHLIQDNNTHEFVTNTCEYLSERYGSTMRDMRITCYHGAGHGLMLGHVQKIAEKDWGNVREFVTYPFSQCDLLSKANELEKEQCKEGLFNLIADWREAKQYGFQAEADGNLFSMCDRLPQNMHKSCYFEVAQKVDRASDNDPVKLVGIAKAVQDKDQIPVVFSVGIAGIMQRVIVEEDGYKKIIASCSKLDDPFVSLCMTSVINGFFEHGEPQKEYVKALGICTLPEIEKKGMQEMCYEAVSQRLLRFYTKDKIENICRMFPSTYRDSCLKKITERGGSQ